MTKQTENGPQGAPYLYLMPGNGNRIACDPADKLGSMYMLDHDFRGCITLPFSGEVIPESGRVLLNGQPVPFVVKQIRIMSDISVWMLGIRLAGYMTDYGMEASLSVSGFTGRNGREMAPAELTVYTEQQAGPLPRYAAHEAVALQAAEEGIVLLKNEEQTLPLKNRLLNVVGEGLYYFQTCAAGAGKINARYQTDFRQAVREDPDYSLNEELAAFFRLDPAGVPDADMLRRAAEKNGTAVMILVRPSGENMDNSTAPGEYRLSEEERSLLRALNRYFRKVVLVLNTGYPIAMDFTEEFAVSAIVYCGFGGMLAGKALLNVLTGRTAPSGRLTSSWARVYDDLPTAGYFYDCFHNGMKRYTADFGPNLFTRYGEGIYMGYRYFTSRGKQAFYPFGYGLSYTSFEESALSMAYRQGEGLRVAVEVTNTGGVPGKHVTQLYVSKPLTGVDKPVRELIAFGKTGILTPGGRETLELSAEERNLDTFSPKDRAYLIEAGVYTLYLGDDAEHVREIGSFEISETIVTRKTRVRMTGKRTRPDLGDQPLFPGVAEMPVRDLIRLSVCAGDGWGMEGTGEAGRLAKVSSMQLPDFVVADGNSGVNMKQKNIGMPSGGTYAASFNPALLSGIGRVIGEEARELGIDMILGPGFNLQRNPLCGRNPEYFSEDPFLAGTLAAAFAKGLESTGVRGCYKHLAANNAEASRKRNDSVMDETTLRNLYLRTFEIALRAYEPAAVMTSYNLVNDCWTSNDPELLLGILREEWGFRGFVMTDWGSYLTADPAEMVNSGVSWITPGSSDGTWTAPLERAAEEGRLDIRQLRENVSYMLRTIIG